MKYSWKRYKDRNRHKNRKKEWKSSVFIKNRNRNVPTTWRWARGVHRTKHLENLRMENSERVPCIKHPLLKKKIDYFSAENCGFGEAASFAKIRGINCSLQYCERTIWLGWTDLTWLNWLDKPGITSTSQTVLSCGQSRDKGDGTYSGPSALDSWHLISPALLHYGVRVKGSEGSAQAGETLHHPMWEQ